MALGVFDAAGIVRLRLHREADVSNVSDLLIYSLEEWESVAEAKGGKCRLLDKKWAKIYKANSSRRPSAKLGFEWWCSIEDSEVSQEYQVITIAYDAI